jgi:hypothetical protein
VHQTADRPATVTGIHWRVQIQVSGWMKVFSPMMGMMLPKQNRGSWLT